MSKLSHFLNIATIILFAIVTIMNFCQSEYMIAITYLLITFLFICNYKERISK